MRDSDTIYKKGSGTGSGSRVGERLLVVDRVSCPQMEILVFGLDIYSPDLGARAKEIRFVARVEKLALLASLADFRYTGLSCVYPLPVS